MYCTFVILLSVRLTSVLLKMVGCMSSILRVSLIWFLSRYLQTLCTITVDNHHMTTITIWNFSDHLWKRLSSQITCTVWLNPRIRSGQWSSYSSCNSELNPMINQIRLLAGPPISLLDKSSTFTDPDVAELFADEIVLFNVKWFILRFLQTQQQHTTILMTNRKYLKILSRHCKRRR